MKRPKILSRHPSHNVVRGKLPLVPYRCIIRLGSTTETSKKFSKLNQGYRVIEVNTVEAIKNSSSKLLMKKCFNEASIKHTKWGRLADVALSSIKDTHFQFSTDTNGSEGLEFPVIVKNYFGSRGSGNYKIDNGSSLISFIEKRDISNYIVEEFFGGVREYRLHVAKNLGCFYTCRKMLKSDTPEKDRWFRNDSNSVWIVETNPLFNKPSSFKDIIEDCLKALETTGLDFAAFDVKVQSIKDKEGNQRKYQDYRIIECNSAPSFAEGTAQKYLEVLPKLINNKI